MADEGRVTLTLRAGDRVVVQTPSGPVTMDIVKGEPGRARVAIVAPRDWPIDRQKRP